MTFLFKRKNDGLQVRSTFPNPTMRDAVIFILDNYEDKAEFKKLLQSRKVEVFAKVRDKSWHPMGVLNEQLYASIKKEVEHVRNN